MTPSSPDAGVAGNVLRRSVVRPGVVGNDVGGVPEIAHSPHVPPVEFVDFHTESMDHVGQEMGVTVMVWVRLDCCSHVTPPFSFAWRTV